MAATCSTATRLDEHDGHIAQIQSDLSQLRFAMKDDRALAYKEREETVVFRREMKDLMKAQNSHRSEHSGSDSGGAIFEPTTPPFFGDTPYPSPKPPRPPLDGHSDNLP